MRKSVIVAAIVLAVTTSALAMTRPAEIAGSINATRPYGSGSLSWLFLTAYDASLWTDAQQWSMNEPFALTLVYRMSFSTEELVDRTINEMKAISPGIADGRLDRYRAALSRAFPPVKSGDRITALHTPGAALRFFHNGKPTGDSRDATLAEPFFAIWLSPKTPEPKLRVALLRLPG
jgi:hypothetical protein